MTETSNNTSLVKTLSLVESTNKTFYWYVISKGGQSQ